jgi:hypothetical protein
MLPAKPGAHAGAAPPHWRSSAGADWGARARRRQPLGQGWRRAHITGRSEALCGRDAGKRSALWLLGPQACQLQTAGQAQVGLRDCLRTQTLGWRTIRRGMTLTQGGAAPGIKITGAMIKVCAMLRAKACLYGRGRILLEIRVSNSSTNSSKSISSSWCSAEGNYVGRGRGAVLSDDVPRVGT